MKTNGPELNPIGIAGAGVLLSSGGLPAWSEVSEAVCSGACRTGI